MFVSIVQRNALDAVRRRESGARRQLLANPLNVIGVVGIAVIVVSGAFANVIAPYDAAELHLPQRLLAPNSTFLLGTDQFGRDLLSRILFGSRISLFVGVLATAIGTLAGVALGAIAGFRGGWLDELVMRAMDVVLAFPSIVLAIAIAAVLGPSIANVVVIIGFLQIPHFARVTRASVLAAKELEFVLAARTVGQRALLILLRHVLPHALGPLIVLASLTIPGAITTEAALSFLGLGVQPPTPSWGNILADGRQYILQAAWMTTFPGLAITLAVISFNFVGDGLRDALDPRTRR